MMAINAKLGKFAVMGNIDDRYWSTLNLFSDTGFEVLDGSSRILKKDNEMFCVSGVDCKFPQQWEKVLKNVPQGCLSVFLYHTPDLIEDLKGTNVNLYLCGHTHGGQVNLPFYGALITFSKFGKKYASGLYNQDDIIMYVNRGIGLEGGIAPRVRFFARPEIAVFDIVPRK
jgi:predicted MPP superfamily phosphohydrolase